MKTLPIRSLRYTALTALAIAILLPVASFARHRDGDRAVHRRPHRHEGPHREGRERRTIVVRPGESIQAALDRARPGTRILVLPGVYHETSDPTGTNAVHVTKSGIRLIGLSRGDRRVVVENAGGQMNGIVVVPEDRTQCMGCHESMSPPFALREGVAHSDPGFPEPLLHGIEIKGITIRGFSNNGLFTERVNGFHIQDVQSIDNADYGIFPTRSVNGVVENSYVSGSDDAGIWVETSENVVVRHNLVEDNVNGLEVSNSDNILFLSNESRFNTAGALLLLESDLVPFRPTSSRNVFRENWIHDNNRVNTGAGGLLAAVPQGTGILHLAVDDARIEGNTIENNDFVGIAVTDFCLAVMGTSFDCSVMPPAFDPVPERNRIVGNLLANNGTNPPSNPFSFVAGDIALLTLGDKQNCFEGNLFASFFSLLGLLPGCP